jgi:hypothetical protein
MYNPLARMWNAHLAPPPSRAADCDELWMADWNEYCALYRDFEAARMDPDPGRPHLKDAIDALARCNYVHLGTARVIQTDGALRTSMVLDITDRRYVLKPPPPERIHWCDDDSVNLNTQTGRMCDVRGGDNASVLSGAEPMDDDDADEETCIYLTRDPRTTNAYASLLWQVANQRKK